LGLKHTLLTVYDKQYKKLMILSFLVLFACMASLVVGYARTGEWFDKGVSLKGGITMTIPIGSAVDIDSLENSLILKHPGADFSIREITERGRPTALIVEASDISIEDLESALPEFGVPLKEGEYSVESMGSALGQQFFSQIVKALIFAFIAMAVVVFKTLVVNKISVSTE